MEIMKKAIVFISIMLIFIIGCSDQESNSKQEASQQPSDDTEQVTQITPEITEAQLDDCTQNDGCIVVSHQSCSGSTKKAINKKYLELYNSKPEWQKTDDPEICARIGMMPFDDSKYKSAICNTYDYCELVG